MSERQCVCVRERKRERESGWVERGRREGSKMKAGIVCS